MPFLDAIIVTAPTVRFNDFEILATPTLRFATPFSIRRSVAVHGRTVCAFFAIVAPHRSRRASLPKSRFDSRIDILGGASRCQTTLLRATSLPHLAINILRVLVTPTARKAAELASCSPRRTTPAHPLGRAHRDWHGAEVRRQTRTTRSATNLRRC